MKKILSVLSLALIALTFVSCNQNTPEGVVTKYVACIQNGQYEEAIDLFYFKKNLTDSDKQQYANLMRDKVGKEIDKRGGLKGAEVTNVQMSEDGNSAKVDYTMKYGDGSAESKKADVVKVDGVWKLDTGK